MSGNLGFDVTKNLSESATFVLDERAINNLGGTPIASDLTLFKNNTKNTSSLTITSDFISGNTIQLPSSNPFVYSNGTEIRVNNQTRYVGDSNSLNRFRLYSNKQLTNLVQNPPVGEYIRSDVITKENISRYVITRRKTVEDFNSSLFITGQVSLDDNLDSLIELYRRLPGFIPSNISDFYITVDQRADLYFRKRDKSIRQNSNFTSINEFFTSGYISITDAQNRNATSLLNQNPGVFILDVKTGNIFRSFSSKENVWDETVDVNFLVADTQEISVNKLTLTSNSAPSFTSIRPVTSPSSTITGFTHFLPIYVNNELYSLCLIE
jgi:hypothetical protein